MEQYQLTGLGHEPRLSLKKLLVDNQHHLMSSEGLILFFSSVTSLKNLTVMNSVGRAATDEGLVVHLALLSCNLLGFSAHHARTSMPH
jgi:hypothetical protein